MLVLNVFHLGDLAHYIIFECIYTDITQSGDSVRIAGLQSLTLFKSILQNSIYFVINNNI